METKTQTIKGGEFLVKESEANSIFIPEEFDEEQNMIAQTCREFLEKEVFPNLDKIDAMEEKLMESLLDKAGELGILGISIPEEYGGFGKDFITSMLSKEVLGAGHSFAVAVSAHTGIGTLPLLYYGTNEQKAKYLPKLCTGEWKACYCLTEPGSGSDANSGKTNAKLSSDGKFYILNGQKMWITNAGFADIFTVFAKIENDENLSAFIVEKNFDGIELGAEEKKMGIKGSSTRQVFFNNCKVPVENLLGKRNEGFKIALNILNVGRIMLAAAATGAAKETINHSVRYANERVQFGNPIANYGAIKYKLSEQVIRTFATESALYRTCKNIQDAIQSLINNGKSKEEATIEGIRQFATEAAILKVFGSESLDYVVDEGVQIYGGMGYSAEAPMERAYRDSRINRIFEGTNEINRMLIVDMLLKKALKGEIDLMGPAMKVAEELMSVPSFESAGNELFAVEKKYIKNFKKSVLMIAGSAVKKLMQKLKYEQEILLSLADMIIQVFIAESMLLRAEKLSNKNKNTEIYESMLKIFIYEAANKINKAGNDAINIFTEGDEQKMLLMGLKRFTKVYPVNIKNLRHKIADKLIAENKYCF